MSPIDRDKADQHSPRREHRRRMQDAASQPNLPWPTLPDHTQSMEPGDPAAIPHAHMDDH